MLWNMETIYKACDEEGQDVQIRFEIQDDTQKSQQLSNMNFSLYSQRDRQCDFVATLVTHEWDDDQLKVGVRKIRLPFIQIRRRHGNPTLRDIAMGLNHASI